MYPKATCARYVFVEGTEKNGDLRVKDSMGRIWFLNKEMLK